MIWHHRRKDCSAIKNEEDFCPFHKPSLHPMIEEPMHLRETGLIERICIHGIGHPDPDSVQFMDRVYKKVYGPEAGGFGLHGCDGCCSLPERYHSDSMSA